MKSILLVGPPGVGKGTQGRALGTLPGFFHCACGDVFWTLDANSELGQIFAEYSSKGELVPDKYTIQLWLKRLNQLASAGEWNPERDVLILDGIPRNAEQAAVMDEHIDVLAVIVLGGLSHDELVRRIRRRALQSNRLDDAEGEVIRRRLKIYEAEAKAVVEFYPESKRRFVNADQSPLEVLEAIIQIVKSA